MREADIKVAQEGSTLSEFYIEEVSEDLIVPRGSIVLYSGALFETTRRLNVVVGDPYYDQHFGHVVCCYSYLGTFLFFVARA